MSDIEKISHDDFHALEVLDNPYEDGIILLETYGKDLDHVKAIHKIAPLRVWTVLDCGDDLITVSGYHYVNRFGYYITKREAPALGVEVEED